MSDLIGKTLGSYRIISQIGAGGMATVYKAYQPSMDRYVAVKVLPPYLSQDEQFAKRFQREAKAVARLEHAHILPVHDYGEAEGITYLVMRFVEGGTLKQRIAAGLPPLSEIDRIIGQIGSALDYAHRIGVIHRDVKPGNVLIDEQGDTYLTDFGLARMLEASDQLTASGVGVGTPAYMSPEQGQGVKVDHRSDIYSLGVILYEMVTGHVPYEAETPMAVMLKHITEPLPLPRTVNPDVPEPIERVILKAMAKDPAHRYQTAGEMVQALNVATRKVAAEETAREPKPIATRPAREEVSLITRLERTWRQPRGKAALIGAAIVVVALLALAVSQLPGQVQIVGPGAAPIEVEGVTATPAVAAAAPTREATTTPATAQARVFAEPILAAIANRSPDYQDDFSDPKSGWPSATYAEGERSGEIGYKDGEYFLIANPASATYPTVHSWLQVPAPDVSDFVMEFDARVISAGHGSIYVHFRVQEKNVYAADVAPEGRVRLATQTIKGDTPLAETRGSPLKLNEVNRVRIIAKGSRIVLYLNDRAVLMADKEFTERGGIILGIWNGSSTLMQVNFDNFKVWNISQLPSAESQVTSLWTTNGPYGGPVNSLAINSDTPTTLYATVFNIGVFRTRNGGESWELVFASEYNNPVAMDPLSPDRIYMGRSGEGLYRSDDGGDTWAAIPIPGKSAETYLAAAHPTLAGTVYAGLDGPCPAGCGLFKSEDYGQTWIDWTNGLTDTLVTALAFDPVDPLVMYVGTGNGNVFRSANGGETWEFIGQPDQYMSRLAVNPFGAHEVWASGADGGGRWGFVWKYASGAWLPVSLGGNQKISAPAIVFDQNAARTIWLGTFGGGFKSTDGGLTWTDLSALPRQLIALAVDPTDPRVVYQGYNGDGVYKTTDDGVTWQEVNQGLTGLIPNGLAIAPDDPNTVYATVHGTGIFKTTDGGKTWLRIPTENEWPRFPIVDPVKPGRLYVGGTNGVDITENDGAAWHRAFPQPPPEYAACCAFELLSMITTGQPGHMVIGGGFMRKDAVAYEVMAGSIYTSDDFGETWAYVDVGREISPVVALAYDPGHPNTIYAAASGSYVLKSTDGGNTWQSSKTGLDSSPGIPGIESIAVEPAPPYRVFAGYGGGLFVSTNEGASWTAVNAPPYGDYGIRLLGFVPGDPPALYASSARGFFCSIDGARSWQQVAGALGSQVSSMAAAVTEGGVILYVGASGGVYRLGGAPTEAATPLSPQAEQARAFAEPILAAIANRKSDYQDDFSDPKSGWTTGPQHGGIGVKSEGELGYLAGEYFGWAAAATADAPSVCVTGFNQNVPDFSDFMLEADLRLVSGERGDVSIQFRNTWGKLPADRSGMYALVLGRNNLGFLRCAPGGECSFLSQAGDWAIKGGGEWNHFQIVAKGPELAAYANGRPVLYVNDSGYSEDYRTGIVSLPLCNHGDTPAEARWDNLRIWNLVNVPGLP